MKPGLLVSMPIFKNHFKPYCSVVIKETMIGTRSLVTPTNEYRSKIDIGRPSRAVPVTPPGIRVRTTAVRLAIYTQISLKWGSPNESK